LVAHPVRLAQQRQGEHPQQDARRTGPRSAAQVAVAAEVVDPERGHPLLARRRWERTSKDEAAYPVAGLEARAAPQVQASQQEPRQQEPAPSSRRVLAQPRPVVLQGLRSESEREWGSEQGRQAQRRAWPRWASAPQRLAQPLPSEVQQPPARSPASCAQPWQRHPSRPCPT
jgi:hypothetical protein